MVADLLGSVSTAEPAPSIACLPSEPVRRRWTAVLNKLGRPVVRPGGLPDVRGLSLRPPGSQTLKSPKHL